MVALETSTYIRHTLSYGPRIQERVAEMSRLINAALVDKSFCDKLLFKPESAIEEGYNGEQFSLSRLENDFVVSVKAKSLEEFANRWLKCSTDMVKIAEYIDVMLPARTEKQ
jgi:hypothetical protein